MRTRRSLLNIYCMSGINLLGRRAEAKRARPKARAAEHTEDAEDADGDKSEGSGSEKDDEGVFLALTIKRRPPPATGGAGEPTAASLLVAKGKVLGSSIGAAVAGAGITNGYAVLQLVKRKREGMQTQLAIKKKTKT